ncbi:MAG: carbamoyltransferase [Pyrinomonadaceae bacterium]
MSRQQTTRGSSQPTATLTRRAKRGRVNVIGISTGYHDSACSLLQDGALVAAAQEERFSRVKNDKSFPKRAFTYCLREGGITIADVDCIAYYEDPCLKMGRQIWMSLIPGLPGERRESMLNRMTGPRPLDLIRQVCGYRGRVEIFDHHLSHAASSYYFSGFEESAILTVDGVGDWATTTYGFGKGPHIERIEQVDFPDSLGFFYSAITGYLGFEVNEGEYKVMGLAPYGEPEYVEQIGRMVEVGPGGQYRLDMKYFGFLTKDCMFTEELVELLGQPPRDPESELTQFHMDVARSAQVVLEEIMLEKTRYIHSKYPSENLCMAGGVALNVVANGRCLREGPFKRLFVQPAAGDAGGSVGAAAMGHVRLTGEGPPVKALEHVYLGPANSTSAAYRMLQTSKAKFKDFRGKEDELIKYTVDQLVDGKVIGWSQGRMEFGPRSLGARSILADPRRPEMQERINALVKMRESFRPFAPAVLESEAAKHFDLDHPSPFMLETCQVISDIDLPSITHIDNSARIQTVNAESNPRFAALLEEFHRRTGCPIILNTSFNVRGEPIVCTPFDTIVCFIATQIDLIVLEDFVLDRAGIPSFWELRGLRHGGKQDPSGAVEHSVYTLL